MPHRLLLLTYRCLCLRSSSKDAKHCTVPGAVHPLMRTNVTQAKHEPGQVPCSIYRKNKPDLFGKERIGEWVRT